MKTVNQICEVQVSRNKESVVSQLAKRLQKCKRLFVPEKCAHLGVMHYYTLHVLQASLTRKPERICAHDPCVFLQTRVHRIAKR